MSSGQFTPAHAVQRPALLRELDRATTSPLTAIVAQAGSGKSVLLSQWVESRPDVKTAWVSVIERDDDPAHLIRRLIAQLESIHPGFDRLSPLAELRDDGLGAAFREELLRLIDEVPPFALVLDDLHRLSNPSLLADIGLIAENAPAHFRIVVASRADPPVSWNGLRLRGQLTEIRQSALALTVEESQQIIERVSWQRISTENATGLVERTEGWAAGIQLAGLSLRGREDVDTFVREFEGSDRLVAEYLGEEVLQTLTPDRRNLLLRFSALDRMSGELVRAVMDDPQAAAFFEVIEQPSMFLIPLHDHHGWYRFHHLFRDLLRHRLRTDIPDSEPEILVQAARWHQEHGDLDIAIEYYLRARAWSEALTTILSKGTRIFERGEMAAVVGWLQQIPEHSLRDPIDTKLLIAILQGIRGRAVESEDMLGRIANDPAASTGQRMCAHTFLATLAQWRPRPASSIKNANRALELLEAHPDARPPDLIGLTDRSSLETMALISMGRAYFLLGDLALARKWLERGIVSAGASYPAWRISGLASLALVEAWGGQTKAAMTLADEAIRIAAEANLVNHPATSDAYLARALDAHERHEQQRAETALRAGEMRAVANGRTQVLWVCAAIRKMITFDDTSLLGHPADPPPPVVRAKLAALEASARIRERGQYEPLTDREKEFLVYLPTLYSQTEIAAKFYVSVNTVKTHMAHIYRKLDVTTRKEAITRGREIGLLEPGEAFI